MPKRPDPCLLKRGEMIVFEGDSLTSRRTPKALDTWPYLRLMNWDQGYAEELSHWLFCVRPDLNLRFLNTAVGGSSCREVIQRIEPLVLPARPDWVIMTLGGNDSARKIPIKEFRSTMTQFAERLAGECGTRVVFVAGFRPCPNLPEGVGDRYTKRASYYRVLRQIAERFNGLYLDVGKGLQARARLLHRQAPIHTVYSDGGHFNTVGNRIIAAEVLTGLGVGTSPS